MRNALNIFFNLRERNISFNSIHKKVKKNFTMIKVTVFHSFRDSLRCLGRPFKLPLVFQSLPCPYNHGHYLFPPLAGQNKYFLCLFLSVFYAISMFLHPYKIIIKISDFESTRTTLFFTFKSDAISYNISVST